MAFNPDGRNDWEKVEGKNFPYWHRHMAYKDANHTLNDGYMMGGTVEGNRRAGEDSKKEIMDFLERLSAE